MVPLPLSKVPEEHEFPTEAQSGAPKLLSKTAFWGPFPPVVGDGACAVGELETGDAVGDFVVGANVGLLVGDLVGAYKNSRYMK